VPAFALVASSINFTSSSLSSGKQPFLTTKHPLLPPSKEGASMTGNHKSLSFIASFKNPRGCLPPGKGDLALPFWSSASTPRRGHSSFPSLKHKTVQTFLFLRFLIAQQITSR